MLRRRRMTRNYSTRPVADDMLERVLAAAARAPAAGNTDAVDVLVLSGPDETSRYWDATLPEARRATFAFPGLLSAPVLLVPWVRPEAYPERYAETDKARTGLGESLDAWLTPYWWVDGGQALALLQLAAIAEGLGVCLFGVFDHEPAVRSAFGVPDDRRALGALAIGHPLDEERPGRSSTRSRRGPAAIHRGRWHP